jgi:hypothetical protein
MIKKDDVWTQFYPVLTTDIVNERYPFTNSGNTP